ncbi:hypothetical protein DUNSADRAFT_9926 [Dunaliella salina]|uniref:Encoded protein n=1 Tax=Dunaliella salina TaxID=3046 RepID=A0ABQ7GGG4_DUNSA|nr:hypothetical protein DUNSADRAFT_9926 [Dunaliella salina]|eukprot:KAF5833693.1 hypothetical protein DUNSADRAFT_9926 [Dunaliella salina]
MDISAQPLHANTATATHLCKPAQGLLHELQHMRIQAACQFAVQALISIRICTMFANPCSCIHHFMQCNTICLSNYKQTQTMDSIERTRHELQCRVLSVLRV